MQVRLLGRFTKQVVVNFDPDTAGANAAEKSIDLLTAEDFNIKVVALEGGLDPDQYVRQHGIQAYMAALRRAKRYSDYLIDRARQLHPSRTPEAKVKAMNFLLPHIRRMNSRIQRDEFVADAAQKLGIDSAILLQELKQAAAQRLQSVSSHRAEPVSEAERVLLRALVLPESAAARVLSAEKLAENLDWYEGLPAAPLFDALAHGLVPDNPIDAAPDDSSRAMLAQALFTDPGIPEATASSAKPQTMHEQVENALLTLHRRSLERRQRELRAAIAEADRRGDAVMSEMLLKEKMQVDRALRLL